LGFPGYLAGFNYTGALTYGALNVSYAVAYDALYFTGTETYFARHLAVFAIFTFDITSSVANFAGFGPAVHLNDALTETLRATYMPGPVAVVAGYVAVAAAVITIDEPFAFTVCTYDPTGSVAV
jgi:hypothetical protein